MAKTTLKAGLKSNKFKIEVKLDLIEFKEDNMFYVFSPHLNLYGYDTTEKKARESFQIVLEEYFKYTTNKDTLLNDLKKLGWVLKKNTYSLPELSKLLVDNPDYSDILNNHDYKKYSKEVEIPLCNPPQSSTAVK